jgi:hypothetical protein
MGAIVHTVTKQTPLPGGGKLIRGTLAMSDSYDAGGSALNLANYFLSTSSPTVMIGNLNAGYAAIHNGGTAASGVVQLYVTGSAGTLPLAEANASLDLSALAPPLAFIAVGQAY